MGKSGATPLPGQVTEAQLKAATPSEALVQLLTSAQADHRKCIEGAAQAKEDPVDKCALTWGNVVLRYRQFGAYRAPFESETQVNAYNKYWTKKRVDKHEQSMA